MLKTSVIIAPVIFIGWLLGIGDAQEWQPAVGPLATRWSKQVSPKNVLPEYPRPQLVRPRWTNLNGLWDYSVVDVQASKPEHWDGRILVPFAIESSLSGVMKQVGPTKSLWYRRKWQEVQRTATDRVLLHFGAVDWEAQVWVNGKPVGEHRGGYAPFSFDITAALRADSVDQELVIRVWDPSDAGSQPRGKQVEKPQGIFYTAVTGIWQTVWTEVVPAQFISSVRITPEVDRAQVSVQVDSQQPNLPVTITIRDGQNEIARGEGKTGQTAQIAIKNVKLWSPTQPHLYDVNIRLSSGDEVNSYFGMRKIEMGKDAQGIQRMLLNGEPVFQLGPLDQGWWPDGLYTAPTDEALKYDIEITRAMGFNMARKHVKVEPERWYYWADKLGLLVWQDMPSLMARGQNQQVKPAQSEDVVLTAQEAYQYLSEWRAIMDANYNHPSIVVWVPFNEGWGQHETNRILKWTKDYDATRLIDGPSGWEDRGWGELKDMHMYPGPGMFPVLPDRISVLGEFGGLGLPMPEHLWQKDRNWGYRNLQSPAELTQRYRDLITRLHVLIGQGLSAAIYTQTTDVEGEVNGLLTYDREVVKMDPSQLARLHASLNGPAPIEASLLATSETEGQMWRFSLAKPEESWTALSFDDSSWKLAPGGFGSKATPNTKVRTEWTTEDVWLRHDFNLDQIDQSSSLWLRVFHDEDCEIYVNGVLAAKLPGFNGGYELISVSAEAKAAVRAGKNVLAVHCHQSTGGQYIDVGLSQLKSAAPSK